MSSQILIAYATKHGSTQEVAEAIATALRAEGHRVDVANAADVADVDRYATVVVGGSLYMGHWHHDPVAFLKQHQAALRHLPLAVFCHGPEDTRRDRRRLLTGAVRSRPRRFPATGAGQRGHLRRGRRPEQAALPVQPHAGIGRA